MESQNPQFKERMRRFRDTKTFLNSYYAAFIVMAVMVALYHPQPDLSERGAYKDVTLKNICVAHLDDWIFEDDRFRGEITQSLGSFMDPKNKRTLDIALQNLNDKLKNEEQSAKFSALKQDMIDQSLEDIAQGLDIDDQFPPVPNIVSGLFDQNALDFTPVSQKPKIAFIFDDLGSSAYTKDILDFPAPVTLAFLPDSKDVTEQFKSGAEQGHELIIHMPMEAGAGAAQEEHTLKVGMSRRETEEMLDWAFNRSPGVIGLNNHTGSKFTADKEGLNYVMSYLKKRGGVFIDSKTAAGSKVEQIAIEIGVPTIGRDVFLDHENTEEFIKKALIKTQSIAKRYGSAIAIGHPRAKTIKVMTEWFSSDAAEEFELVPVSFLIRQEQIQAKQKLAQSE